MKKLNLNTKYLKTGGYSVLVSVIAIAIIIVINLFVNALPTTWTQFDLSAGDMLSVSEESEKIVSGIETDVKVYYIAQHGSEDSYVTTMLDKYKAMSKKLTVEQIDPALNPNFLTGDRLNVTEGSLIVESEKRSKIISSFEIYYPGYTEDDLYQYYYQYGQMPQATGFDLENLMTTAVSYVTTDVLPIVYNLTGHGEMALSEAYKGYLTSESMELKELNLATLEAVPEDCDAVLICAPEKDISEDEANRLLDYLKKGGRLLYVSYFAYTMETEHTNLASVLKYYGLEASKGVIYEGDSKAHYPQMPFMLLSSYGTHEIVTPLNGYYMFLGYCQGINETDDKRDTVTVTPLLSTTDKAYAKLNIKSETVEKEEGDIEGPFDYAVAVTDKNEDGSEAKLVWVNSPMFIDEGSDVYGTVEAMFKNTFGWMCDKAESISIPAKQLEQERLTVNEAQGNLLSVIFTIVIPVAVVGIGFVVFFRRRSK